MVDASGQSLAYFYARENDNDAGTAGVLTMDEARRLASNFAPGANSNPRYDRVFLERNSPKTRSPAGA